MKWALVFLAGVLVTYLVMSHVGYRTDGITESGASGTPREVPFATMSDKSAKDPESELSRDSSLPRPTDTQAPSAATAAGHSERDHPNNADSDADESQESQGERPGSGSPQTIPTPETYGPLVTKTPRADTSHTRVLSQITSFLPILVTLIAGGIAYWRYLVESRHSQYGLLNTLFGELGSLLEHYTYSVYELPVDSPDELLKQLHWSKYGDLHFSRDVSRCGFLNAGEIQLLLQLGLRVRNNDHLCDLYLAQIQAPNRTSLSPDDIDRLRSRMAYIMNTTKRLLDTLVATEPTLEKTLASIMEGLPTISRA